MTVHQTNGNEFPAVKHFTVADKENALHFINEEERVMSFIRTLLKQQVTPGKNVEQLSKNLETSAMFMSSSNVLHTLMELQKESKNLSSHFCTLPQSGEDFLRYYFESPSNLFFEETKKWMSIFRAAENQSEEMESMLAYYDLHHEYFHDLEKRNADNIQKLLSDSFDLEGLLFVRFDVTTDLKDGRPVRHLRVTVDKEKSQIFGYRHYYFGIRNDIQMAQVPSWIDTKFGRFFGLYAMSKRAVDKENEKKRKLFYQSHVVNGECMPDSVTSDIEAWFSKNLQLFVGDKKQVKIEKIVLDALHKMKKNSNPYKDEWPNLNLVYQLQYDMNGLMLELVNTDSHSKYESDSVARFTLAHETFAGYAKEELDRMNEELNEIGVTTRTLLKKFEGARIVEKIHEKAPFILGGPVPILHSEGKFKWAAYDAIIRMPEIAKMLEEILSFRRWVKLSFSQLLFAATIIDNMQKMTDDWKVPMSMPRMVDDNRLSFDKLYPVQLIGRSTTNDKKISAKDIAPISFGEHYFNGNLTGLTGENAGGKTVCEETVILNLSLAQCGLPILGTNFEFSPKSSIGSVFLERAEGSTMQELAQKTKTIFTAIENEGAENVLVILDELGSGTAPTAALIYGEKVLRELHSHGVSVLFSTQYNELAEKLEADGIATIFNMDEFHKIRKGVKIPDIEKFLKREGFDVKIKIKK